MTPLARLLSPASLFCLFAVAHVSEANAQTLVEYDPVGGQGSAQGVFPTTTDPLITASELTQMGFGGWGNTNVWPVGQLGSASPTLDPGQYVTFTIDAPAPVTYTSLSYSRQSYLMDGNRAASVRTSVDNFASDAAVLLGIDPNGAAQLDFDLTGLAPTMGPVEFRIYFYDAPIMGADWVDLVSTAAGGTGLVLTGDVFDDVGTNYCTSNPNSTGLAANIDGTGTNVVADNDLTIGANNLPNNAFGFFLTSQAQGFVANPAGSSGNLCLGGAIGRYVGPGQIQQAGSNGRIELALDLTMIPQPNGFVSVMAGETWNYQAWYRDAVSGMATSNFTDGLQVDF